MLYENDSLVEVPLEDLPKLKEKFRENWPIGLNGWNTLDTQYRNKKNISDFPSSVCAPYGSIDNGIVCVWKLIPVATEISIYSMKSDISKIIEAILESKRINWSTRIIFCCVLPEHVQCAYEVFHTKNIQYVDDQTYIAYIDQDTAKNFDVELPSDVCIELAHPEHAAEMDEVWPHRYPGSLIYFQQMIRFGFATVLLGKEKGELRGWVLNSVRGDMHAVQVKEEYRRRGYAQLLVRCLGRHLAENGREVFGCIVTKNLPSKLMFEKMNFQFLRVTHWVHN